MRRFAATALLMLSCVLVALSIVAAWLDVGLLDTERYVSAVAPVADDAEASEAATSLLVRRLTQEVSVTQAARDLSHAAAGPLPAGALRAARRLIQATVESVVASDQYAAVWRAANRASSPMVREALVGNVATLHAARLDGRVLVDITPALLLARARLVRAGMPSYRNVPGDPTPVRVEVADLTGLHQLRSSVHALSTITWVLPLAAVACLGCGLFIAERRLRAATMFGGGLTVAFGLILVTLWAARHLLVDSDIDPDLRPIQAAVFDAVTAPLRTALAIGIAVGAMVLVAAGEVARGPHNAPHT